ncbi:hypothetical protein VKT23_005179 [Stygiomarasmius scandens]|uniref:Uncharacterized protein n=1 Tax=Marasmiellus scandens TaxID=2682957 RepID=A0ABR1JUY4_9AGAR
MPQQTDFGTPTRIDAIQDALVGQKLRLAGRMMCYSEESGLILLVYKHKAVLVDVSLAIGPFSHWVNDRFITVTVVGHLEKSPTPLIIPTMPNHAPAPNVDTCLVLNAVLATPVVDLNLDLWNSTIDMISEKKVIQ